MARSTHSDDPLFRLLSAAAASGAVTVHNARGGFACNSSSSHSIVVVPDHVSVHAEDEEDPGEFGWDDFALTESGDKIRYLAAMLTRRPDCSALVTELCAEHGVSLTPDANVDHQSVLQFPADFTGDTVDQEFIRDLAATLCDPRIAVLGGNDNGGDSSHVAAGMVALISYSYGTWRARKDILNGQSWWVLFNADDGTKVRISLDPTQVLTSTPTADSGDTDRHSDDHLDVPRSAFSPAKAATPELVDVKLTDRCPFELDCGFCFAGETEYLTRYGVKTLRETVGTIQEVLVNTEITGDGSPVALTGSAGVWRRAEIRSFGQQRLCKVTVTHAGQSKVIHATPEHRWLTTPVRSTGTARTTRRIVTTAELGRGDQLASLSESRTAQPAPDVWTVETVEDTDRFEEVYCAVVPGNENFTLAGNINVMNCYMGSTRDGVEADPVHVANLLAGLAALNVFEVAFGGGEPTVWPAFEQTLSYSRSLGVTPNFTTKNFAWLTQGKAGRWLDLVGAVAFSVNTAQAMDRLSANVDKSGLDDTQTSKISVQLIPDLVPTDEFRHIVTAATGRGWRVTLLGYKQTGRGAAFTPAFRRDPGWWLAELSRLAKTHYLRTVAVDTALVEQSKAALDAAGVPRWMYHVEEGRFSAYVDAVTGTVGPSSYCDRAALSPLDLNREPSLISVDVNTAFAGYTHERGL